MKRMNGWDRTTAAFILVKWVNPNSGLTQQIVCLENSPQDFSGGEGPHATFIAHGKSLIIQLFLKTVFKLP